MATNKEIYDALVLLQEECRRLRDDVCEGCEIKKMYGYCPFMGGFDSKVIKKPSRFTDTDILWAKAAKASGAKEITMLFDDNSPYAVAYTDDESCCYMVCFPASAFQSLKPYETVQIDDILKEGKEENG